MKRVLMTLMAGLLLALGAGMAVAQSGYDLFQKALAKERAEGNIPEAIQLYQRIVKEHAGNRGLAAKALVQMGQCYEKLGKAEARRAYERVVREYADQPEQASEARTRLAALSPPPNRTNGSMLARRIWTGRDVDTLGSVSPDGRFLSFVDWSSGDLAIRNLATGENRRLTNNQSWDSPSYAGFAEFSRISPDGKLIAYDWLNRDSGYGGDLRIIGVDGTGYRVLYKNPEVPYVGTSSWSPDGKHILAGFSRADRSNQIALISLADGSARSLKTTDWRAPGNAAFSPDGKYIVYDFPPREDSLERDIYLLSADGSREIRLVEHPAQDTVLGWTPDGRHVLFASDRTGTNDAWIIPVSDGKAQGPPEVVKKDMGRVLPLGFTRSGSYFYGLATGMVDVYTAALDVPAGRPAGPPLRVAQRFIGTNSSPDWSPDGRWLVYVSGRGRHVGAAESRILCIASAETGQQRDLPLKLTYIAKPRWSPDGRSILVKAQGEKKRPGLYLVDAQTASVTLLLQVEELRDFAWSRDGKSLFYVISPPDAENSSRQIGRLLARDLETGAEKEMFRQVSSSNVGDGIVNDLAVSPDGSSLAFTSNKAGEPKALMVIPTTGGPARAIYRVPRPRVPNFSGLAWTPDGQELLFVTSREQTLSGIPGNRELWAISVKGGEPRPLGLTMLGLREGRLHPSGGRVAFTAGENRREVWALENFLPVLRAAK